MNAKTNVRETRFRIRRPISSTRLFLVLGGLGAWFIVGILVDPVWGLLAGAGIAIGAFAAILGARWFLDTLRRAQIEAQLPIALHTLAAYLQTGQSMDQSLERLARETGGPLGLELRQLAVQARSRSKPWDEGLLAWARASKSPTLSRAVNQWAGLLSRGTPRSAGKLLGGLAKDLVEVQRARMRLASSKLAFSSMILVIVAGVVPALFLSFAIVASAVMDFGWGTTEVAVLTLVGFPMASALVVAWWMIQYPSAIGTETL